MDNNFSTNLKKIRKEHNLSQEQLADELGVSRQAISKWESSVAYPEMDKIIALCDKFNLNIDDLLHKDIREIKGEEESKKKLNKSIDDFLKFITDTINLFSNMNFKSKIKCLFEQIIILAILFGISTIIVVISNSIFSNLLSFLPYNVNHLIQSILESIIIIFLTATSIIILTHIFKTRYLDYYNRLKNDGTSNLNSTLSEEKNDIDEKIEEEQNLDKKNKILFKNNENKVIIRDPKHSEYRFINALFKFIIMIIKFFGLCFSLFLCFILICLVGGFIISFMIYKTGLFFIGIIGLLLSLVIIDVLLILIIFNCVFGRKNNKKNMIWIFIISLIIFGVSCGITFIGTLNFEVLENNDGMLKTETKEYEMRDGLFFRPYHATNVDYIESDINNIKLEYSINKLCVLEDDYNNTNGVYVWTDCPNSMEMLKAFIENINNNKIMPINNDMESIKIYASKENIEKFKSNWENYLSENEAYEETINFYENRITELENKLTNYENKVFDYENKISNLEEQIEEYKIQIKENN